MSSQFSAVESTLLQIKDNENMWNLLIFHLAFLCVCFVDSHSGDTDYFWHITDIHYDPWYGLEGWPKGGISCIEENAHEKYGNYECDSPWALVESSIKAMRKLKAADPKFILWSGDNGPHVADSSLLNRVDNPLLKELTRNITNLLKSEFPNTLCLPIIGNHDYYPKNQLPGETNELYEAYADMWTDWLDTDDMQATFKRGAYFSTLISDDPPVRAIVLNTNLYLHNNRATAGQEDPGGQIAWLENLLQNARAGGEKVYLFYHVPPGKFPEPSVATSYLTPAANHYFERITVQYSDVILASSGVHAHKDLFKLFYDDNGQPVSALYLSPPVAALKFEYIHDPGLRSFHFDRHTYRLTDIEQYKLELQEANNGFPFWERLYTFTTYHHVDGIDPEHLNKLKDSFKQDGSYQFRRYFEAVYTSTGTDDFIACDCECKWGHICGIQHVAYEEFDQCVLNRPSCDIADDDHDHYHPVPCYGITCGADPSNGKSLLVLAAGCIALFLLR